VNAHGFSLDFGEIVAHYPGLQRRHALRSGVGSDPVKAEQVPWSQDHSIQRLVGRDDSAALNFSGT